MNRGQRWPLMIDPQNQANKWIKNMEKSRGLKVLDLKMPDFLRSIEHAVQLGTPILMQVWLVCGWGRFVDRLSATHRPPNRPSKRPPNRAPHSPPNRPPNSPPDMPPQ